MSILWKLVIGGVSLFTRVSSDQIRCNLCDPSAEKAPINLPGRSTSTLFPRVKKHPAYQKLLDDLREEEKQQKEDQKGGILKFLNSGEFHFENPLINYF